MDRPIEPVERPCWASVAHHLPDEMRGLAKACRDGGRTNGFPGRLAMPGVFVTQDGGVTWAQENAGFGNIVTESLHLQREGAANMLYAFTHGRGAWRVRVRE